MSKTVHSVKLLPYDAVDLNSISYMNGDVVYDNTNGTLRIMNGVTSGGTSLATQPYVATVLQSYVTNSALNTALNSYVTTTGLTSTLSSYVTSSALSTSLTTALTTALSPYVTTANLTTTLSSYDTISARNTALSSYTTTANLTTTLNSYASNASPVFTGTLTTPIAIVGGVNIKSFSIAMGAALA